MFDKILIANRGEIAIRIIRTCNRLGISTVAVYSDADSRSLHRHLADEAVHIGESASQKSYLDISKIIDAAKKTGAQAIHPGYGFLSEKADFAQAIKDAGLVLIGPSVEAIDVMGDKITSKELAKNAGVPVIPGHIEAIKDEKEAIKIADEIGYPILLKPAAGGGGKGMRIVRKPEEMKEALEASRKETQKAFNDTRVFVERYIEQPRHIEIQILADSHGNVVHLGERECSIQRRYQKVIEESPSPAVSPELRERMGKAACDLARVANYVNAGTVEYVLDAHQNFYFLEMNTRLQVEHPVTEMVTGLDLVEWQLRIASGEMLPFDQKGVRFNGWAIEARICAEDPSCKTADGKTVRRGPEPGLYSLHRHDHPLCCPARHRCPRRFRRQYRRQDRCVLRFHARQTGLSRQDQGRCPPWPDRGPQRLPHRRRIDQYRFRHQRALPARICRG